MRYLLLILFCTVFRNNVFAFQTDTTNYYSYRIESGVGSMIKNYPDFPQLKNSFQTQASFIIHTNGKRSWHSKYNFLSIALNTLYTKNGNDSVLGSSYSILPGLIFESKREKRINFETEIAVGFAYFDKFYNMQNNIENFIIGSRLTNATRIAFRAKHSVLPKINIGASASFTHFSNGHYQLPNVGANIVQVNFFLSYLPNSKPNKYYKIDAIQEIDKGFHFVFKPTFGMHEFGVSTKPTGGAKYPVYSLATYFTKRTKYKHNWHFGLITNYYTSYFDFITLNNFYSKHQHLNSSTFSAVIGHEFIIGHFGVGAQFAIYLFNPFFVKYKKLSGFNFSHKLESIINNRFVFHYYLHDPIKTTKNKLFLSIGVKANSATADYFDYGLGFAF